jgi:predicted nucleic acid-binding protein
MARFVADASVTLPWCFHDETSPYTEGLLSRLITGDGIAVPAHWMIEVLNGVIQGRRRGRVDESTIQGFFESLRSFDISIDEGTGLALIAATRALAERHKLTAYDAAYLELAMRAGLPLATLDAELRSAAAAEKVTLL